MRTIYTKFSTDCENLYVLGCVDFMPRYEKWEAEVKELLHTVEGVSGEMKIRDYMKFRLGFSSSLIGKVKYGGVFLNGVNVHMRAMVKNGDALLVHYPEEQSENVLPIDLPLTVVYEDDSILVVDKPSNMPIHPSRGNHLPTLANAVSFYMKEPFVFRAITRLDRDTSGIVLIAKNQLAAAELGREITVGGMEKVYHARVVGVPTPAEGEISAPIVRECEGSIRRVIREDGKESLTRYRVLSVDGEGNALCEVRPITGRTHQIRVHMAHIGHPLKDDFLYGEESGEAVYYLRCVSLTFTHPMTKERMHLKLSE